MNAYGLTECGGVVAFSGPDDPPETWAVSSGRPFRGIQIKIKDLETSRTLTEPHQPGQIWVRGYNLFEGYYKDPAKDAECFDEEGWFFTGDIGSLDAEGRISYLGRTKDMLKVGGENVAAVEIESYLQTHPAVAIAQVVALPDEKYQEVPAAFCELKPGTEASEEELIEFCRGEIAGFKIPRHVRLVAPDEWPMSATKIQKFRLADKLRAELGL